MIEVVEFDGTPLATRAGTFDAEMVREIFEDRYYTCDGWDIPQGATVLDLGGGIGAFAVYAITHGAAEVHTFEPIPESFDLLELNAAPYGERIISERAAVAVEAGTVHMSGFAPMPDGTVNTGLPAISAEGLEVPAVGIHDVLARRERWDVVKVDIEGYEYELIAALTPAEFAKIDVLTMEFHHHDEATTHQRGAELAEWLTEAGYRCEVGWTWGQQGRLRARR